MFNTALYLIILLFPATEALARTFDVESKKWRRHSAIEILSIEEVVAITHIVKAPSLDLLPINKENQNRCLQHIQMIATNEKTAKKAAQFSYAFHTDQRLATLGICLSPVIWLNESLVTCDFDGTFLRANCQLEPLKPWLEQTTISHLVILVETTKAYTYQGVMYLDAKDNYDVFVHELAHFAGFMDEYSLPETSAKLYCDDIDAINVISLQEWQASSSRVKLWREYSQSFKASNSVTCNAVNKITIKPSDKLTFLEYYDTAYIPELYINLWRYQLEQGHQFNLMRQRLGLPLLLSPFHADHSSVQPTSE